jgi:hypothetical protein
VRHVAVALHHTPKKTSTNMHKKKGKPEGWKKKRLGKHLFAGVA